MHRRNKITNLAYNWTQDFVRTKIEYPFLVAAIGEEKAKCIDFGSRPSWMVYILLR